LKGACQPKAGSTEATPGCVSSMTREQFEKLVKALTPPDRPAMPPDMMRNFATQYAKLLTFIPRNQGTADKPKPSDEEQKAYADQIQKRWVAGEDPDKLEKEATEHS